MCCEHVMLLLSIEISNMRERESVHTMNSVFKIIQLFIRILSIWSNFNYIINKREEFNRINVGLFKFINNWTQNIFCCQDSQLRSSIDFNCWRCLVIIRLSRQILLFDDELYIKKFELSQTIKSIYYFTLSAIRWSYRHQRPRFMEQ